MLAIEKFRSCLACRNLVTNQLPFPSEFHFRCHMRLGGRSPLTKFIRYGSFVLPPEGFIAQVHNEINELALHDLQLLPLDTLEIDTCGRRLEVTVDMRNTQFIGADRTVGAFPDGYEPDILALMDMFIGPDDTFIDMGRIGVTCQYIACCAPIFVVASSRLSLACGPGAICRSFLGIAASKIE